MSTISRHFHHKAGNTSRTNCHCRRLKKQPVSRWLEIIVVVMMAVSLAQNFPLTTTALVPPSLLRHSTRRVGPITNNFHNRQHAFSIGHSDYSNQHNMFQVPSCRDDPPISSFSALSSTIQDETVRYDDDDNPSSRNSNILQQFTLLTPLWTVLAAMVGLRYSTFIGPTLGSVSIVSKSLFILMFAMALSTTPAEFSKACRSPKILVVNAICCFGIMPWLAVLVARCLHCTPSQTIGTILLGSVCGGQASNLFSLLAGGDVSLSVVCTLSTTLLGVVATPLLVKSILSSGVVAAAASSSSSSSAVMIIVVNGMAVLRSVVSLVLGPLLLGLGLGRLAPKFVDTKIRKFCPLVGIGATLLLVAGGAANSCTSLLPGRRFMGGMMMMRPVAASVALPLAGGAAALLISRITGIHRDEAAKRTLVVEVLSKSPTLAYVLARKHFNEAAASVPAAAMVTLAVVGALVASIWSTLSFDDDDDDIASDDQY